MYFGKVLRGIKYPIMLLDQISFLKKPQVFCTPLGKYMCSSWLMGHASLVLKLNFGLTPLLLHLYAMEFCLKDNIDILV